MHTMSASHTSPLHPPAMLPAALGERPAPQPAMDIPARRRLSSQTLLGNEREVEIEHAGQLYRLRLTSLGKLILTK